MAAAWDVQLAPHCPLGPIALAACLQLDLAVPDFYAQEHVGDLTSPDSPDLRLLRDPSVLIPRQGYIERLVGPGLGIEVDEDAVRAADRGDIGMPKGIPTWTYEDGSFAEW
jgi:galactonate dehydratase